MVTGHSVISYDSAVQKKVRKTVREMLYDRGYDNFEEDKSDYATDIICDSEYLGSLIVKFTEDTRKGTLDEIINESTDYDIILIVLYDEKVSPDLIIKYNTPNHQLYPYQHLLFNISRHKMVPNHELMNEHTKEYLKLNKKDLPLISRSDPMARYLHLKEGDMCKITRKNNTIFYRRCL